jgi:hypothetical protein
MTLSGWRRRCARLPSFASEKDHPRPRGSSTRRASQPGRTRPYRDARRRRRAEAGLSEACHEADLGTAAAMEHLLVLACKAI